VCSIKFGKSSLQSFWLRILLEYEAKSLPFRIRFFSLATLMEFADSPIIVHPKLFGLHPSDIISRILRTTRHPWLMKDRTCLRQGLLAYRFLRAAGFQPELHFGIDSESLHASVLRAHCWVVMDGKIVVNPPTAKMVRIFRYPFEHSRVAKQIN